MAEYLCPDTDMSLQEKKWIFRCRVDDIEVRGNRRWKYSNMSFLSCTKNIDETQEHLLNCEGLLGMSDILTYIPEYLELI